MNRPLFGIVALSFAFLGVGCATTTARGARYSDAEVELAQRQAETETLARLASSSNDDIADSASTLARQHATQ